MDEQQNELLLAMHIFFLVHLINSHFHQLKKEAISEMGMFYILLVFDPEKCTQKDKCQINVPKKRNIKSYLFRQFIYMRAC